MDAPIIDELTGALNAANPFLEDDERHLAVTIYRLLAAGQPVALDNLARESGADPEWIRGTLDGWTGVFRDDEERVIAFWGLALPEMPNRFEIDGTQLYTWCAWDPLFIAPLLGTTARVTSTCPITNEAITFVVGPDGVRDIEPAEAVLSFLRPTAEMREDVIESFCHYVLLFASRPAADTWIADHPDTFALGIEDAFELGRRTLGRLAGGRG